MTKPTKYIALQGKGKWSKLDVPDTKFNPEGVWKQTLYPNAQSLNILHELKKEGIRNVIKKDEDGEYATFSRPAQKTIKGRIKAFAPPEIMDKDGNPLPRNTRIGNGSDLTVNIELYHFLTPQKTEGCAARLASVRIDNLVAFTKDDYNPEQLKQVKGLAEHPPQLF